MNRISLERMRLALRYRVAVQASIGGGWLIVRPTMADGVAR